MSSSIIQITKKLEEIEERRKNALLVSSVGIWEWDIENDILIWDEAMFDIYNINPSDFSGKYDDWKSSLHPEDFSLAQTNLLKCIKDPTKRYFYRFRIKRDDKWEWVSGIGNTIRDENGKATKVIGINILEPTN